MKKLLLFVLICLCTFIFVSCDDKENNPPVKPTDPIPAECTHELGEWVITEKMHSRSCECGSHQEEETHIFGLPTIKKEATETSDGTRIYKCEVCGYEKEETYKYSSGDIELPIIPIG